METQECHGEFSYNYMVITTMQLYRVTHKRNDKEIEKIRNFLLMVPIFGIMFFIYC